MKSCSCRGPERAFDTKRFEGLLDKLVALRMDLGSLRKKNAPRPHVAVSLDFIAGLNEILLSAVGDVRNLIRDIDASNALTAYQLSGEPSHASLQG
jgi:hypothetical protein